MKQMDKSWIHHPNRLCNEYVNGLHTFIGIARNHVDSNGNTRCPCRKCLNAFFKPISVVQKHLFMNEFSRTYETWIFHEDSLLEASFERANRSDTYC